MLLVAIVVAHVVRIVVAIHVRDAARVPELAAFEARLDLIAHLILMNGIRIRRAFRGAAELADHAALKAPEAPLDAVAIASGAHVHGLQTAVQHMCSARDYAPLVDLACEIAGEAHGDKHDTHKAGSLDLEQRTPAGAIKHAQRLARANDKPCTPPVAHEGTRDLVWAILGIIVIKLTERCAASAVEHERSPVLGNEDAPFVTQSDACDRAHVLLGPEIQQRRAARAIPHAHKVVFLATRDSNDAQFIAHNYGRDLMHLIGMRPPYSQQHTIIRIFRILKDSEADSFCVFCAHPDGLLSFAPIRVVSVLERQQLRVALAVPHVCVLIFTACDDAPSVADDNARDRQHRRRVLERQQRRAALAVPHKRLIPTYRNDAPPVAHADARHRSH